MKEQIKEHKWRLQDGFTPNYKALHEVYITKDLGPQRNQEVIAFIAKHIAAFKGHTEDKAGIPLMLFERVQDAQTFANNLSARLDIHREHVSVKARKFTR